MGLDMYAYKTSQRFDSEVDFDVNEDLMERIHHWQKHPNLHGWMEHLYLVKGGQSESFNTVNLLLTLDDLELLEKTIINNELPFKEGCFFGTSDGSEREDDLAFVEKAKAAIHEGKNVFYHPWW